MKKIFYGITLSVLCLISCGDGESILQDDEKDDNEQETVKPQLPISLNVNVSTKATDTEFETNDQIGLYVVNYQKDQAGTLKNTGNYVDNEKFTYTTSWNSEKELYWLDDKTPADFYTYYPYGKPTDVKAYTFSIQRDQSTEANYKKSEFLWGKTQKVTPTDKPVSISMSHKMSCALVKVEPGKGFTTEKLDAAHITVSLNQAKAKALVDLSNGQITADGELGGIQFYPLGANREFKALVVPQHITNDKFITVSIDGKAYYLKKDFTFIGGKRHTFTVTVSKTSNGIDVNLNNWENDNIDNGGVAE